MVHSQDK